MLLESLLSIILGWQNSFNDSLKLGSLRQQVAYIPISVQTYGGFFSFSDLFYLYPKYIGQQSLALEAKSAIAVDSKTNKVLYSKNHNESLPIASLSKIMTAYVVLKENNPKEVVTISRNAYYTFGNKRGLVEGENISVENLLKMMLIDSNNVAAVALAEHNSGSVADFVVKMNQQAEEWGLVRTKFINPSGLDEGEQHNVSTAYELACLVRKVSQQPLLWDFSLIVDTNVYSVDGKIKHYVKNTNTILKDGYFILGGKTGYTEQAGQCLLLRARHPQKKYQNEEVVIVLLNSENRFKEMKKSINWIFSNYQWGGG